jgi:phage regulator Rha-like protein
MGFFMSTELTNILIAAASMTSVEIAGLVESRHDSTKLSMERLAERGVIVLPPLVDIPFVDESGRNRSTSGYIFSGEQGRRDSIIVVAQLSPEFTGRLVDRWQELEASAVRPLSPAEFLVQQAQMLLEQERRVAKVEEEQRAQTLQIGSVAQRLDQIETAVDYFTILGWHRISNRRVALPEQAASQLGKAATKFCKQNGIQMGTSPDTRYGTVHTYPKWVLDQLFG